MTLEVRDLCFMVQGAVTDHSATRQCSEVIWRGPRVTNKPKERCQHPNHGSGEWE